MPETGPHQLFGQLAVARAYVTRDQLMEALDEQARAGEPRSRLGQILLGKGWMTHERVFEILRLQGRFILRCNRCGGGFEVVGLPADRTMRCLACGADLQIASTREDLEAGRDTLPVLGVDAGESGAGCRFRIGRYVLVRELARADGAIVFEARERPADRRVALKLMAPAPVPADLARHFHRDGAALPKSAPFIEVGVEAGTPYVALEYVEGPALQEILRGSPVSSRAAAPGRRIPWLWLAGVGTALALIAIVAVVRGYSARSARVQELRAELAQAEQDSRLEDVARLHEEIAAADSALAVDSMRKAFAMRQHLERERALAPAREALDRARAAIQRLDAVEGTGAAYEGLRQAPLTEFFTALRLDPASARTRAELADFAVRQLIAAEREDRDAAGWQVLAQQFHDGRYAQELEGTGWLEVTTDPAGAQVLLDGREIAGRISAPIGRHIIATRLAGYRESRSVVKLARRQTLTLMLRLFTPPQVGDDFVHVPAGEAVLGERPQTCWVGDFFISRRPLPARRWEEAAAYAEELTMEARAQGERVTYRLPLELEWEKAARAAGVYGLSDVAEEWCAELFGADGETHALRGAGLRVTQRRGGDDAEVAPFRLVRAVQP